MIEYCDTYISSFEGYFIDIQLRVSREVVYNKSYIRCCRKYHGVYTWIEMWEL